MAGLTYRDSGVDIDEKMKAFRSIKQLVKSTFTPGVLTDIGGFGGLYALNKEDLDEPVLVSSTDGVGTKLKVAFACGVHDTVGVDLVSHCVNDILVQGARPLFFLDYISMGKLNSETVVSIISGLARGCREADCALVGGETAEMPGIYSEGEYDLAGTIVGIVERSKIILGSEVEVGDAIIGLASSGLHTNGYSLARKIFFDVLGMAVDTVVPELGCSVGEELLKPHRCYERALRPSIDRGIIKAMAHITGGGFYDNIPRVLPEGRQAVINRGSWNIPPIFTFLQRSGDVPEHDMYRTFNMGIGMIAVVRQADVAEVIETAKQAGDSASVIGSIESGPKETVLIR